MYLEAIFSEHYHMLNENEKEIARYIIENEAYILKESIEVFAKRCLTSKSTLLRLAQKMGYSGYAEFKYSLKQFARNSEQAIDYLELLNMDINSTINYLEQYDFKPLIKHIFEAKRIYCFATGYGQRNILNEMMRILIQCKCFVQSFPAITEFEMSQPLINKDDLVIVASLSGNNSHIQNVITSLKMRGVPIVSITMLQNNWLSRISDFPLFFQINPILCVETDINTTSFLTMQLVIEYILRNFLAYMNKKL